MKNKSLVILLAILQYFSAGLNAQGTANMHLGDKDFSIWAYQQHSKICKAIYDNIQSKKLLGYSAKNIKETYKETVNKIKQEVVIFYPTNREDPTVGIDSTVYVEKSENYYFFKVSEEYILMKPSRGQANVLKLKKTELYALMDAESKDYFRLYTSNFMVCIDSIPVVSKRLLNDFNSKLFEYCKLPSTDVYTNDSIKTLMGKTEKEMKSQIEIVRNHPDPNDPEFGLDTILSELYNIRDAKRWQVIVLAIEIKGVDARVIGISSGIDRGSFGYSSLILPFGFLPYPPAFPFAANDLSVLNAIINMKLMDRLNEVGYFEGIYDDYFEGK